MCAEVIVPKFTRAELRLPVFIVHKSKYKMLSKITNFKLAFAVGIGFLKLTHDGNPISEIESKMIIFQKSFP